MFGNQKQMEKQMKMMMGGGGMAGQQEMFQQMMTMMMMGGGGMVGNPMMEMMMMGGGMPHEMQGANAGGSNENRWKEHLHNTLMKKSPGAEKPTYTTEEDENRKYIGTVIVEGEDYTSGEKAISKKAAEHGAAKAAMEAKFPEEFAKLSVPGMMPMMSMMPGMNRMKGAPGNETRWKNHLHNTLVKQSGTAVEKPMYSVEGVGPYVGTVTVDGETYTAEEPAPSKKAAEEAAAKAAMVAKFPAEFVKFSQAADPMMQGFMGQGQKRKGGPEQEQSSMNKLLDSLQLIITKNHQRNMSKDDIDWDLQELGDEKYQVTVTIKDSIGEEGGKTFTGEVCDSKKKAKASAAEVAYENMKDILGPLEEEHKEKKRKKNQESLEALKKRTAEKKAALKGE